MSMRLETIDNIMDTHPSQAISQSIRHNAHSDSTASCPLVPKLFGGSPSIPRDLPETVYISSGESSDDEILEATASRPPIARKESSEIVEISSDSSNSDDDDDDSHPVERSIASAGNQVSETQQATVGLGISMDGTPSPPRRRRAGTPGGPGDSAKGGSERGEQGAAGAPRGGSSGGSSGRSRRNSRGSKHTRDEEGEDGRGRKRSRQIFTPSPRPHGDSTEKLDSRPKVPKKPYLSLLLVLTSEEKARQNRQRRALRKNGRYGYNDYSRENYNLEFLEMGEDECRLLELCDLVFDPNGEFQRELGKGEGADEYQFPNSGEDFYKQLWAEQRREDGSEDVDPRAHAEAQVEIFEEALEGADNDDDRAEAENNLGQWRAILEKLNGQADRAENNAPEPGSAEWLRTMREQDPDYQQNRIMEQTLQNEQENVEDLAAERKRFVHFRAVQDRLFEELDEHEAARDEIAKNCQSSHNSHEQGERRQDQPQRDYCREAENLRNFIQQLVNLEAEQRIANQAAEDERQESRNARVRRMAVRVERLDQLCRQSRRDQEISDDGLPRSQRCSESQQHFIKQETLEQQSSDREWELQERQREQRRAEELAHQQKLARQQKQALNDALFSQLNTQYCEISDHQSLSTSERVEALRRLIKQLSTERAEYHVGDTRRTLYGRQIRGVLRHLRELIQEQHAAHEDKRAEIQAAKVEKEKERKQWEKDEEKADKKRNIRRSGRNEFSKLCSDSVFEKQLGVHTNQLRKFRRHDGGLDQVLDNFTSYAPQAVNALRDRHPVDDEKSKGRNHKPGPGSVAFKMALNSTGKPASPIKNSDTDYFIHKLPAGELTASEYSEDDAKSFISVTEKEPSIRSDDKDEDEAADGLNVGNNNSNGSGGFEFKAPLESTRSRLRETPPTRSRQSAGLDWDRPLPEEFEPNPTVFIVQTRASSKKAKAAEEKAKVDASHKLGSWLLEEGEDEGANDQGVEEEEQKEEVQAQPRPRRYNWDEDMMFWGRVGRSRPSTEQIPSAATAQPSHSSSVGQTFKVPNSSESDSEELEPECKDDEHLTNHPELNVFRRPPQYLSYRKPNQPRPAADPVLRPPRDTRLASQLATNSSSGKELLRNSSKNTPVSQPVQSNSQLPTVIQDPESSRRLRRANSDKTRKQALHRQHRRYVNLIDPVSEIYLQKHGIAAAQPENMRAIYLAKLQAKAHELPRESTEERREAFALIREETYQELLQIWKRTIAEPSRLRRMPGSLSRSPKEPWALPPELQRPSNYRPGVHMTRVQRLRPLREQRPREMRQRETRPTGRFAFFQNIMNRIGLFSMPPLPPSPPLGPENNLQREQHYEGGPIDVPANVPEDEIAPDPPADTPSTSQCSSRKRDFDETFGGDDDYETSSWAFVKRLLGSMVPSERGFPPLPSSSSSGVSVFVMSQTNIDQGIRDTEAANRQLQSENVEGIVRSMVQNEEERPARVKYPQKPQGGALKNQPVYLSYMRKRSSSPLVHHPSRNLIDSAREEEIDAFDELLREIFSVIVLPDPSPSPSSFSSDGDDVLRLSRGHLTKINRLVDEIDMEIASWANPGGNSDRPSIVPSIEEVEDRNSISPNVSTDSADWITIITDRSSAPSPESSIESENEKARESSGRFIPRTPRKPEKYAGKGTPKKAIRHSHGVLNYVPLSPEPSLATRLPKRRKKHSYNDSNYKYSTPSSSESSQPSPGVTQAKRRAKSFDNLPYAYATPSPSEVSPTFKGGIKWKTPQEQSPTQPSKRLRARPPGSKSNAKPKRVSFSDTSSTTTLKPDSPKQPDLIDKKHYDLWEANRKLDESIGRNNHKSGKPTHIPSGRPSQGRKHSCSSSSRYDTPLTSAYSGSSKSSSSYQKPMTSPRPNKKFSVEAILTSKKNVKLAKKSLFARRLSDEAWKGRVRGKHGGKSPSEWPERY